MNLIRMNRMKEFFTGIINKITNSEQIKEIDMTEPKTESNAKCEIESVVTPPKPLHEIDAEFLKSICRSDDGSENELSMNIRYRYNRNSLVKYKADHILSSLRPWSCLELPTVIAQFTQADPSSDCQRSVTYDGLTRVSFSDRGIHEAPYLVVSAPAYEVYEEQIIAISRTTGKPFSEYVSKKMADSLVYKIDGYIAKLMMLCTEQTGNVIEYDKRFDRHVLNRGLSLLCDAGMCAVGSSRIVLTRGKYNELCYDVGPTVEWVKAVTIENAESLSSKLYSDGSRERNLRMYGSEAYAVSYGAVEAFALDEIKVSAKKDGRRYVFDAWTKISVLIPNVDKIVRYQKV
jgi:hypothetical protein